MSKFVVIGYFTSGTRLVSYGTDGVCDNDMWDPHVSTCGTHMSVTHIMVFSNSEIFR